jgi:hypothetical protein
MQQLSSVESVARHYGLSPEPFIRSIERGTLPGVELEGRHYTHVKYVERLMTTRRAASHRG